MNRQACADLLGFYRTLIRVDWRFIVDNSRLPCPFIVIFGLRACRFIAGKRTRIVDITHTQHIADSSQ